MVDLQIKTQLYQFVSVKIFWRRFEFAKSITCMYSSTRNLNFKSEFREMNRLENQAL